MDVIYFQFWVVDDSMLTKKKQLCQNSGTHLISKLLWLPLLVLILCGTSIYGAQPHYVPFERDSAVALLQKTVEAKMVPYVIENDGWVLTVTKLQHFAMDWEKSQFTLKCSFEAKYTKLGSFKESGEIAFSGTGLIAPAEQKIGVRIQNISELKLKGLLSQFSSGIKLAADKSLADKEFWFGETPLSSEKLTKDNFDKLVEVAVAQQLPWTGTTDNTTLTFTALHSFAMLPQPGKVVASFTMEGTRKSLVFNKFSGRASVDVDVWIDPEELAGMIKINKITELKLDNTMGLVEGIIKGLVNAKMKGEEIAFSWK